MSSLFMRDKVMIETLISRETKEEKTRDMCQCGPQKQSELNYIFTKPSKSHEPRQNINIFFMAKYFIKYVVCKALKPTKKYN